MVSASAQIRNWRPQSYYDQPGRGTRARDGGGVLITQAIHTLDLLISLAGLPVEVSAYAATSPVHRMETEDVAAAAMRYANGAHRHDRCDHHRLPRLSRSGGDCRQQGNGAPRGRQADRRIP